MIARVKVAPVSRWCEGAKRALSPKVPISEVEGFIVSIETESMGPSGDCEGKSWLVEQRQSEAVRKSYKMMAPETRYRVCEHMLELD